MFLKAALKLPLCIAIIDFKLTVVQSDTKHPKKQNLFGSCSTVTEYGAMQETRLAGALAT